MTDYKKDLIAYRLERARESLRDAEILFDNGGSPASVVNRAYYSIFYATLALLVTAETEPSKHSGAISKFDELFVKRGEFPKEMSQIIHRAFDMRQAGDYQKSITLTREQAFETLGSAKEFLKRVTGKISNG
ncbi:HEPN domain-containing protein [Chloroflexi bacterium CFX5]|nr:MAG: HEPN domain-containing protein [Chloroflexota bacterium]MCE7861889.1 HEPN domain-containing protein [Chloroflexi bacterium CFX2]MCQ3954959.1 DNA-binding protein [Chloroflexota bacterium]MDL1920028.1 HEPN domain-containing protein [Chloroflexi bacterium CFX5]